MKLIRNSKSEHAEKVIADNNLLSIENFISLYNSGMLNKSSKIVADIATIVSEGFKNIELKNKTIFVSSSEEVELDESIEALNRWVPILKLIREVKEEQSKSGEFTLAIDTNGSIYKKSVTVNNETGEQEEVNEVFVFEKIFKNKEKIEETLYTAGIVAEDTTDIGELIFTSSQFLEVDTSFIGEISRIVPNG